MDAPAPPLSASPASADPEPDAAPHRARRTGGFAGKAAVLAACLLLAAVVLLTALAAMPALADALPFPALTTLVDLFFGARFTGFLTAVVFDVAALLGLLSFRAAERGLALEERALGQARRAVKEGAEVLRSRSGSQPPFFSAGAEAIPGLQKTAAYAMAENIGKDALAFRYEPVAMIIDRVAPQVLVGSLNLREAQQLGIRLGILFTFFGMTAALGMISGVFSASGDVAASQTAVNGVIRSLSLGFGTSIAGLLAAVLIQIMAWGLRDRESAVLADMQEAAADMQALYRQAEIGAGSVGIRMDQLKEAITEHRRQLDRQGAAIAEGGRRLEEATRDVAGAFDGPLGEIGRTGERLAALLATQGGAVAALSQATSAVAALQDSVAGHMERAMDRASDLQHEAAEALRAEIRGLAGTIAAEMERGFASARAIDRAGDLATQLARAAGELEAAALAQRRALRPVTLMLAVMTLLTAAGLLFPATPAPAPVAPPVEVPPSAPAASVPDKGHRP